MKKEKEDSMRRLHRFVVLLAVLALVGAACGDGDDTTTTSPAPGDTTTAAPGDTTTAAPGDTSSTVSPPIAVDPDRPVKIAAVQHALCAWDAFWCTVEQGISDASALLDVDVTVFGPDQFDLDATASLIDQAVAGAPDALILTVTDPVLFKDPIMRAIDQGIPVIAYNAGAGPAADGIPYFTYLGQDEYAGGFLGGQRMLATSANITGGVCINHQVGSANLDARCQGFTDALSAAGVSAEVLAISDDPTASQTTISDYRVANQDVNAFLTLGPNGANPFYGWVDELDIGRLSLQAGEWVHGTFDTSPEINANIENGLTLFGIDQQPYLQGYGAVMMATNIVRYGITPALPVTATGPGFVTRDNVGATADSTRPVKIIAVQHALCAWDAFWCVVEKGIEVAKGQLGVEVDVLGPDTFDLDATASLIDQAVTAAPDAIMLTVTDNVLFKDPIQRAIDAGIPVLAYNAGAGPDKDGIPYLTYLGQDEYAGGFQGGQRLIAVGGTTGVCINHQVGSSNLDDRCQGFTDAFTEAGLSAEVLAISDDPTASQTTIGDFVTANPDIDAFLTLGPNGANPFYGYLDETGMGAGDVIHGTFDLSPEIVENIKAGVTQFGIDQQPFLQGYGGVTALALLVRQNIVPALPVTPTGPGFVDASNVAIVEALAGQYR